MTSELKTLEENYTSELTGLPNSKRAIVSKWVNNIKINTRIRN